MYKVIEYIPYRSFKEKITIVKTYKSKDKTKIEIIDSYIYVEYMVKGDN